MPKKNWFAFFGSFVRKFMDWLFMRDENDNNNNDGGNNGGSDGDLPDKHVYITSDEAQQIIKAAIGSKMKSGAHMHFPDLKYYCPSLEYTKKVMKDSLTETMTWTEEIFDCFLPDTPLIIKKNGVVSIVDIKQLKNDYQNTLVLDNDGWTKINWIEEKESSKPVSVVNGPGGILEVTNDHKVWSNGEFVPVSEIKDTSGLISACASPLFESHKFDNELAYAFGLFMAEGHCKQHHTNTTENGWSWHIDMENIDCLVRAKAALEKYTGIEMMIVLYPSQTAGSIRGGVVSKSNIYRLKSSGKYGDNVKLCNIFRSDFYTSNGYKKVPDSILNSDSDSAKAFINGFLDGDGSLLDENDQIAYATQKSRVAVFGLKILSQKCGVGTSIGYYSRSDRNIDASGGYTNTYFNFSTDTINSKNRIFEEDRGTITVYDINTESGKLFAGGFLVKNCDDFAIVLKADFAKDAYRNLVRRSPHCFGVVWGMLPGPHAINWVITDDKQFWFVEPQNDKIYKPSDLEKDVWMILA